MRIDNDLFEQDILPQVEKPGRYVGGELNSIVKDWHTAPARMAFAFPDSYEIGMSHLGLRLLYEAINNHSPHLCERVFMPLPDMQNLLRKYHLPLFTLETRRELRDFDLIGFTLQYELSYTNILAMLDLSGIPLLAAERGEDMPLVIAGGPCAYNPEPLAEIIDLFAVGEGEELDNELLDLVAAGKDAGWSREELLRRAARIPGVYVPRFYQARYNEQGLFAGLEAAPGAPEHTPPMVKKRILPDMDAAVFPEKPILPNIEPVHDRVMLEVMRGCTRGCRFCQAGMIYRPLREKSPELLRRQAAAQIKHSGYDEIALLSLSTADYTCVERLMRDLLDDHAAVGVSVSLPSLRVDAFSVGLAARTQEVRKSGVTLAPEAGSQRLRDAINKGVTEEDILAAAAAAFSQGYTHIKLYFIIGLPYETDEDIVAIAALCKRILQIGRQHKPAEVKRPLSIALGVASFVPKSHTPFQWQGQNSAEQLKRKQELLRGEIRTLHQVTLSCHDREASLLEAAFARGDRRLAQALLAAYRRGCQLDGWREYFRPDLWREAFAACGLSEEDYACREIDYGAALPWAHIDCGVSAAWLWRENLRAARAELSEDCRRAPCGGCGVCGEDRANCVQPVPGAAEHPVQVQRPEQRRLYKYRCRIAIEGVAVWLAHLDILAMLEKALRRSQLPIAFSQGFNPHMQISWGPAHPVGLASAGEYVDLLMSESLPAGWERRLAAALPPGLRLLAAREVELNAPALMAAVDFATYRVALRNADPEELAAAIGKFLQAESVMIERNSPKGRKTVDVRPSVAALTSNGEELLVDVWLNRGAAVKMPELADLLAPGSLVAGAWRTGLFVTADGQHLEP